MFLGRTKLQVFEEACLVGTLTVRALGAGGGGGGCFAFWALYASSFSCARLLQHNQTCIYHMFDSIYGMLLTDEHR